jgi:hypothetical protein
MKMQRQLFFAVAFFFFSVAFLKSNAAVKVAVLGREEAASGLGDFLTAALSKLDGVALVERAELDRVVREQGLGNGLNVGRLVAADDVLFYELAREGTNQVVSLRLAAVREGAVLFSTRAELGQAPRDEWAARMARRLEPLLKKSQTPASEALRISVLNLRSAINSPAEAQLERDLTRLILLRLAEETNVFVLERRQLATLALEKELAASTEQFWTGSYLLDGIVNRQGLDPRTITVSARLIGAGATNLIEISGARTNLPTVVDDLARGILSSLKHTSAAHWDAPREAREHLAEAEWALRWSMWREAQSAADSAWALGDTSIPVATARALAYAREARPNPRARTLTTYPQRRLAWPVRLPTRAQLEAMSRSFDIIAEELARDPISLRDKNWRAAVIQNLARAGGLLKDFYFSLEARGGLDEELRDLRAKVRDVCAAALQNPAIRADYFRAADDFVSPDFYKTLFDDHSDNFFSVYARNAAVFFEKPEETRRRLQGAHGR